MTELRRVVIVGGGTPAAAVAMTLCRRGFRPSGDVISEESVPPYERLPLSKAMLTDGRDPSFSPSWQETGTRPTSSIFGLIAARAEVSAQVLADRSIELRQLARAVVPAR
jgi:hypothetical protein